MASADQRADGKWADPHKDFRWQLTADMLASIMVGPTVNDLAWLDEFGEVVQGVIEFLDYKDPTVEIIPQGSDSLDGARSIGFGMVGKGSQVTGILPPSQSGPWDVLTRFGKPEEGKGDTPTTLKCKHLMFLIRLAFEERKILTGPEIIDEFFVSSAVDYHVTRTTTHYQNFCEKEQIITLCDGTKITSRGYGSIVLDCIRNGSKTVSLRFTHVYFCPELSTNMLSALALAFIRAIETYDYLRESDGGRIRLDDRELCDLKSRRKSRLLATTGKRSVKLKHQPEHLGIEVTNGSGKSGQKNGKAKAENGKTS